MGKKPVIVIAPEDVNDAFGIVFIMNKEYGDCIREAGGIPMGAGDYRAAADYADFGDALLIPGGPDIHMARYGQYFTDSAEIASFSNTRDDFDFALCEGVFKGGKADPGNWERRSGFKCGAGRNPDPEYWFPFDGGLSCYRPSGKYVCGFRRHARRFYP